MTENDPPAYDLVMPYVVCESNGGPYDGAAFVAGARCASIEDRLAAGPETLSEYVEPALVPQLDLAAMHYGYTMTSEPWDEHPDEWALVTFSRVTAEANGETGD